MFKIIKKSTYEKLQRLLKFEEHLQLANISFEEDKQEINYLLDKLQERNRRIEELENYIAQEKKKRSEAAKKGAITRAKNKAMKNLETP